MTERVMQEWREGILWCLRCDVRWKFCSCPPEAPGSIPITEEMLKDVSALEGELNRRLVHAIQTQLDAEWAEQERLIMYGNPAAKPVTGILNA